MAGFFARGVASIAATRDSRQVNERMRRAVVLAGLVMISAGWLASCGDDAPSAAVGSGHQALPVSLEVGSFVVSVDQGSAEDRAAHRAMLSEISADLPPETPRPTDEEFDECVDELVQIEVNTREPTGPGIQLLGEKVPPETGLTLVRVVGVDSAQGAVAILRAGSEVSLLEYEGKTIEFVQNSTWIAAVIPNAAVATPEDATVGALPPELSMTVDGIEQRFEEERLC